MIISRLQSVKFWKRMTIEKPEKVFNFKFDPKLPAGSFYSTWLQMSKSPICPICRDYRSFVVREEGKEEKSLYCICSTLRWIDEKSTSLSQFETPVQRKLLEDLRTIALPDPVAAKDLQILLKFLGTWLENPLEWMLIQGGPGVGKSHILAAIKTRLPYLVTYISAERFQQQLFAARTTENGVQDLVEALSLAPILLFDDWGLEHNSSWTTDTFAAIINRRYSHPEEWPTVVTTNIPISQLLEGSDISIKRIASRLADTQVSEIFRLRQVDFRSPIAQQSIEKAGM